MILGCMPKRPASGASPSGGGPMKTRTLPGDQQGAWFDGPGTVTMLRVYGTALEFELPRRRQQAVRAPALRLVN